MSYIVLWRKELGNNRSYNGVIKIGMHDFDIIRSCGHFQSYTFHGYSIYHVYTYEPKVMVGTCNGFHINKSHESILILFYTSIAKVWEIDVSIIDFRYSSLTIIFELVA